MIIHYHDNTNSMCTEKSACHIIWKGMALDKLCIDRTILISFLILSICSLATEIQHDELDEEKKQPLYKKAEFLVKGSDSAKCLNLLLSVPKPTHSIFVSLRPEPTEKTLIESPDKFLVKWTKQKEIGCSKIILRHNLVVLTKPKLGGTWWTRLEIQDGPWLMAPNLVDSILGFPDLSLRESSMDGAVHYIRTRRIMETGEGGEGIPKPAMRQEAATTGSCTTKTLSFPIAPIAPRRRSNHARFPCSARSPRWRRRRSSPASLPETCHGPSRARNGPWHVSGTRWAVGRATFPPSPAAGRVARLEIGWGERRGAQLKPRRDGYGNGGFARGAPPPRRRRPPPHATSEREERPQRHHHIHESAGGSSPNLP